MCKRTLHVLPVRLGWDGVGTGLRREIIDTVIGKDKVELQEESFLAK